MKRRVAGVVQSCKARAVCQGRPSVGGRLAAGGARNEQEYRGTICRPPTSVPSSFTRSALQVRRTSPGRLAAPCERQSAVTQSVVPSRRLSKVPHVRAIKVATNSLVSVARGPAEYRSAKVCRSVHAPASTPARVALERSGCQNATCTRRRHLTRRSSGRSKACCARFSPPLISNVGPQLARQLVRVSLWPRPAPVRSSFARKFTSSFAFRAVVSRGVCGRAVRPLAACSPSACRQRNEMRWSRAASVLREGGSAPRPNTVQIEEYRGQSVSVETSMGDGRWREPARRCRRELTLHT